MIRTFRGVLETTVTNGSQQLRLQKKVSETSGVNTNVGALFVGALVVGGVTVSGSSRWLNGDLLGVGVVQQFFLALVRHCV